MIEKLPLVACMTHIIKKINEIIDILNKKDRIIYCPECLIEDLKVKLVDNKCPQCNGKY